VVSKWNSDVLLNLTCLHISWFRGHLFVIIKVDNPRPPPQSFTNTSTSPILHHTWARWLCCSSGEWFFYRLFS
jgi:hypothetical protein